MSESVTMKEILKKYAEDTKCTGGTSDLALVIGNGINRYKGKSKENSWEVSAEETLRQVPQASGANRDT